VPVGALPELLELPPKPSALRAANNECRKLCTCCGGALAEAVLVVPVTAALVAAAAEVAAVAAALLVADVDVIAGMPTTCSNDCSKLLNSPWVEVAVELVAVEFEFELDVLLDVMASACKPFLRPRV
jgi:hypothetical protein